MSIFSETVDEKVLDWRFKKREVDTLFSIGDINIGTLYKVNGWSAVPIFKTDVGAVEGFKTRRQACNFLLKVWRLSPRK